MERTRQICSACGGDLPAEAPGGRCPQCLLDLTLELAEECQEQSRATNCAEIQRFGDYELLEEIARGGMGVVYRARQLALNRIVALKRILSGQLASPQEIQRFRAEAEAAARLRHPNVVAIYEVGVAEGHHYFSMEYVQGRDLAAIVRDGPLPAGRAAQYLAGIARAVEHAHEQGVLHRDLKPSNVLIDADDRPRVTDFGLAKVLSGSEFSQLTATGQLVGSPSFMPPEQTSGKRSRVGPWSDVYGMGAILYHLLIGRPPFQAEALEDLVRQLHEQEPVAPRLLNPSIPRDLETICLKCLEKEPARRYASARELSAELDRFGRDEPIQARPANSLEKLARWCRRRPSLAAALGAVGLLLVTLVVGGLMTTWRIRETAKALRYKNYATDLNLASHVFDEKNFGRAAELVRGQFPKPGEPDLRGFEWRLLWKWCEGDQAASITAHEGEVRCLAISPDGHWLMTLGFDQTIKLWDARTRQFQRVLRRLQTKPDRATTAFSTDGSLAAATDNQMITVWETAQWNVVTNLTEGGGTGWGPCLAFVPGQGTLVAACGHSLKQWNCRTWEARALVQRRPDEPGFDHVGCSADGRWLAVARGAVLELWDPKPCQRVAALPGNIQGSAYALTFSPDGRFVAAGGMFGEVKIWDVTRRQVETSFNPHKFYVMGLAFSPDGRFLATGASDQFIDLWSAQGETRWGKVAELTGHAHQIWDLVFAPDSRTLISASRDHTVKFWNVEQARKSELLNANGVIGFTDNGRSVLTLDTNGTVRRWDVSSLQERAVVFANQGKVACDGALTPDGSLLAMGYRDGSIELRTADKGALRRTLNIGTNAVVFPVKLSVDGRYLAVGSMPVMSGDARVRLWDTATGEQLPITELIPPGAIAMAFSQSGKLLALGGADGSVSIWDVGRAHQRLHFAAHSWYAMDLVFSPDDRLLASGGGDATAKLWDAATGRLLGTLRGQTISVDFVCFSPDGRTLAAGGQDKTIKFWHLASQQELLTLRWEGNTRGRPLFSPDGNTLAVGALMAVPPGGLAQLWRAPSLKEIDRRGL